MPLYRDEKTKTYYLKIFYKDLHGKRHNTTKRGFKSKHEALIYERNFFESAQLKNIGIPVLIEKYLADKRLRVKISHVKVITSTLKKHFLRYFKNLKISELTPAIMREWQNKLIEQGYKHSTLKRIHATVSALLNYANKFYDLKENPLRLIGNFGNVNRGFQKMTFWEYKEFERFIQAVKKDKHRICYLILFFGGLRTGELLALNKQDFDFKENKISITKNKLQATGEISTPKTPESVREVYMPAEVMSEVKRYIRRLKVIPSPLFDITHSALLIALKNCAGKAGVKKIRLHDLRHSHVSHLIHLGVPITTISRRLGHKSPKITLEVYSHMYEESGRKTAELIDNVIKNSKKK